MVYHAGEAQPHVPDMPAKSNMDNNIAIVDRKETSFIHLQKPWKFQALKYAMILRSHEWANHIRQY